ncbi:hypothetical protein NE237_029056 [Protea cynaroides]|uniref:Phytocyanin domain-containing protein n=1 Tax=Protea cynaroides TaxID=273540 RepID=A0A9Q0GV29_9MAGN|nr:hypothetical protein NE237_029056 [Protea cynaroides]
MDVIGVLLILFFVAPAVYAKEYLVGDIDGWSLMVDYGEWACIRTFYVGDTLWCPEFAFLMASMARNLVVLIDFSSNLSQSCQGSPRQTHGWTTESPLACGNRGCTETDWVLMPSVVEFFQAATAIHSMIPMGSQRLEVPNSTKATTAAVLMFQLGLQKRREIEKEI